MPKKGTFVVVETPDLTPCSELIECGGLAEFAEMYDQGFTSMDEVCR